MGMRKAEITRVREYETARGRQCVIKSMRKHKNVRFFEGDLDAGERGRFWLGEEPTLALCALDTLRTRTRRDGAV